MIFYRRRAFFNAANCTTEEAITSSVCGALPIKLPFVSWTCCSHPGSMVVLLRNGRAFWPSRAHIRVQISCRNLRRHLNVICDSVHTYCATSWSLFLSLKSVRHVIRHWGSGSVQSGSCTSVHIREQCALHHQLLPLTCKNIKGRRSCPFCADIS